VLEVIQLEGGFVVAISLFVALLVVLTVFGLGYRYFIARNHQGDPPPEGYHDDRWQE
jgi:hypothetical protein